MSLPRNFSSVKPAGIPSTGLATYIAALAKRHDVVYIRDCNGALAEAITRLSGDEVILDETMKLIIALRRANIIDGPTMRVLTSRYLDETQ